MAGAEVYATFRYTVAAGASETIPAVGSYVAILDANQTFHVALDDDTPQEIQSGLTIQMEPGERFEKVTIDNSQNGADLTVFLAIGTGELRDARLSLSGEVQLATPTGLMTDPDVAMLAGVAAQVLAVNNSRKEAFVTNLASNAVAIRVGDSNVGAARGIELSPGQTAVLSTEAAIWVYSPSDQPVAVTEIEQ
ncbi:hypothetical protein [Pelagibius sp.]|uniref:hypothetical protein n=1 Tax=Pelagibius sp. TaxID=1931238 RepID=UPI00263A2711|nr:hypothetical protein [Pelagibius sp.]